MPDSSQSGKGLKSADLIFLDSDFTAIVATFAAYGVVDVPGAAVGAKSQSGSYSLVVGATFGGTGLRLFAFRMCHFVLIFMSFFIFVVIGLSVGIVVVGC